MSNAALNAGIVYGGSDGSWTVGTQAQHAELLHLFGVAGVALASAEDLLSNPEAAKEAREGLRALAAARKLTIQLLTGTEPEVPDAT
jgi:hypothetical protein